MSCICGLYYIVFHLVPITALGFSNVSRKSQHVFDHISIIHVCLCLCVKDQQKEKQPLATINSIKASVGRLLSCETFDVEFEALVSYVDYRQALGASKKMLDYWHDMRAAKVAEFVKENMEAFDASVAPKIEEINWGWHPMYHILLGANFVKEFLPPLPWLHTSKEGFLICKTLCSMDMIEKVTHVPWSIMFLKMFIFCNGNSYPLSHPIKGGSRQNVLNWFALGFQTKQWIDVRNKMKEEGFVLFAGCNLQTTCEEWREHVDRAFADMLCHSNGWWEELGNWIRVVQIKAVQNLALSNPELFVAAWKQKHPISPRDDVQVALCDWLKYTEDVDCGWIIRNSGLMILLN